MLRFQKSRYFFICIIMLMILFVFTFDSAFAQKKAKQNKGHFYYYDKVFHKTYCFKPKNREIMISLDPEMSIARMREKAKDEGLISIHFSEKKHFGIYKLSASTVSQESVISKIRSTPGVLAAIPVMIDQEGNECHFIPHQFTVQFKKGLSEENIQEIIDAHGCRIIKKQRTPGYYTLSLPEQKMRLKNSNCPHGKVLFETIREFSVMEDVEFAEPSFIKFNALLSPFYPNDIEFPAQWNLDDTGQHDPNIDADINAPEAWEIERGNPAVIIAIIDTGMDMNHEDLVGNLLPREDEDWDFSDGPSKIPHDEDGHGTAVAGIAAATTNNLYGVAGIAHNCRLMPLKIAHNPGNMQDYADAINYVVEHATRHPQSRYVINCSWGGGPDSTAIHASIVNAKDHGIFLCFASGNENLNNVSYPAKYPEVMAVGATSPCEERKSPNSCDGVCWGDPNVCDGGSNYGKELDVVAPGVFILTTDITGIGGFNNEGDYSEDFDGTSGACPHVAGLAGLLFSQYPHLSVYDVEDTIRLRAKDIESPGWDEEVGYGKIDAFEALSKPLSFIRFNVNPNNYSSFNDPNVKEICYEGATAIRVHFSTFITQDTNDVVLLRDGSGNHYGNPYHGELGSFTSDAIPGDTVRIDYYDPNQNYGFIIDYYECVVRNVYVDRNATGAGNGTNWENAFTQIQDAINDSGTVEGSTIWVAEGTYHECINFNGKVIALRSITDPERTIIDPNGSGPGVTFINGEDNAILSGFTITGGSNQYGGGICCASSSPIINNCNIIGNSATDYGGGIYCYNHASPTISNCKITGNTAIYSGGGDPASHGGGIYCWLYSSPVITDCIIEENYAAVGGGIGIYFQSNPTITNCTISENASRSRGGGIEISGASLPTIDNCIINGNALSGSAFAKAGGIYCDESLPIITNCIITKNSVSATFPSKGGGIYFYYTPEYSESIVTNCTISENSADIGGGIYYDSSSPTITNSILWGDSNEEIYISSGSPVVTYCDIDQDGFAPYNGNIRSNPQFVDPNLGDFHLQDGSPCIDVADPNASELPLTDIEGNLRDSNPDMGAYEFYTFHVAPGGSIQQTINGASNGALIIVEPGIYTENINFRGKAITVQSIDPDDQNVVEDTVIDGSFQGSVVLFVPYEGHEGHNSVLNGFTLQNGTGTISLGLLRGGGIFCLRSSPTISNCIIRDNRAELGGGIYCDKSSPSIINCLISDNSANNGGGIFNSRSKTNIRKCSISQNMASDVRRMDFDGNGGGIYCYNSFSYINNCTIASNTADQNGGGIACEPSFNPNTGVPDIDPNTGFPYPSIPFITNCTFTMNTANGTGGAIHSHFSRPYMINCILWHDFPNFDEIFDFNAFTDPPDPNNQYSPVINYSDIEGGYAGSGNLDANPLFVDPMGNFHLQSNSPCINSGYNTEFFIDSNFLLSHRLPSSDKDGNPMPVGAGYDMGAYEYIAEVRHVPSAYATIQGAINASNDWDVIIVQPGIYKENINLNGKEITIMSTDPYDPEIVSDTIIDGDALGSVVVFQNGEGENAVLRGFTLQNGSAAYGGGIYCANNSSPGFYTCIIKENYASMDGGGVYIHDSSSPTISNSTIIGNSTGRDGGGGWCSYSSPIITNCLISGNSANSYGGGFCCSSDSSPVFTNCTVSGNSAGIDGGGFDFYYATPTMTSCTIVGNSANNFGGGIDCYYSSPTITNCDINGNLANKNGGGFYCLFSSSFDITNCTINGNTASYYGGGGFCAFSSPKIVNSIISGNNADYAGGIFAYSSSSLTIMNCTFFGNSAVYYGGGIYCYYSSPSITNSILWNDYPQEVYVSGDAPAITYCDVYGGYIGTGNINADPLFVHSDSGDLHLKGGSPCIDMGTDIGAPPDDKDGKERPWDGDGVGGSEWDMGAYEYN